MNVYLQKVFPFPERGKKLIIYSHSFTKLRFALPVYGIIRSNKPIIILN